MIIDKIERVREALERLKQEGLILGKKNKGSAVADITLDEIKDVYAIRALVEGYAVRETMAHSDLSELRVLEQILDDMRQASAEKDAFRMIELDMDFHEFFYSRSNNPLLEDLWSRMRIKVMRFIAVTNLNYPPDLTVDTHAALLNSLKAGNIEESVNQFLQTLQFAENSQLYKRIVRSHNERGSA